MENLTLTGNTLVILIAGGLIVWVVNRRVRRAKREKLESKKELSQNEKDIKTYIAEQKIARGAKWFYWIAGLSAINTFLYLTNTNIEFPAGLFASEMLDVFMKFGKFVGVATVANALIMGLFVWLGYLANKFSKKAFIVGIGLYILDLVLLVWFVLTGKGLNVLIINMIFHVLALKGIWVGWVTLKKLG